MKGPAAAAPCDQRPIIGGWAIRHKPFQYGLDVCPWRFRQAGAYHPLTLVARRAEITHEIRAISANCRPIFVPTGGTSICGTHRRNALKAFTQTALREPSGLGQFVGRPRTLVSPNAAGTTAATGTRLLAIGRSINPQLLHHRRDKLLGCRRAAQVAGSHVAVGIDRTDGLLNAVGRVLVTEVTKH